MRLELICTFLVVVLLVVIVYTNNDKIKIIDLREKETFDDEVPGNIVINGSQSDYVMADILTPGGSNDYVDYDNCEDYTRINAKRLSPNDMLRATTSRPYSKFIVYDDYTPTTEEVSAMTGLDIRRNKKNKAVGGHGNNINSFEHDSKSL